MRALLIPLLCFVLSPWAAASDFGPRERRAAFNDLSAELIAFANVKQGTLDGRIAMGAIRLSNLFNAHISHIGDLAELSGSGVSSDWLRSRLEYVEGGVADQIRILNVDLNSASDPVLKDTLLRMRKEAEDVRSWLRENT